MLGEPGFDKPPAGGEIGVIWRQSPDAVQMVRHVTIALILNGRELRTDRKAQRKTSTTSSEAKTGRLPSVTTVKKNEPPGINARRYFIGCLSCWLPVLLGYGAIAPNPTYSIPNVGCRLG